MLDQIKIMLLAAKIAVRSNKYSSTFWNVDLH